MFTSYKCIYQSLTPPYIPYSTEHYKLSPINNIAMMHHAQQQWLHIASKRQKNNPSHHGEGLNIEVY